MIAKPGEVTCILNGFRRPNNLNDIHQALLNQTVKPVKTMLWYNKPEPEYPINQRLLEELGGAMSLENLGVWPRFMYALMADTEYVCVFDDDTVPGSRWLENCIRTIQRPDSCGLLGTVGLRFHDRNNYWSHTRYGWPNNNKEAVEVDIVGHSWFLRREWLHYLFVEPPLHPVAGEDIQLSYMLQKYLGVKTFVPPHPPGEPEMFGSLRPILGVGKEAISCGPDADKFQLCYQQTISKGWRLISDK